VNLAEVLLGAAATTPDAPALYGPGATVSFGELAGLSARAAGVLLEQGVGPGERVGLVAPNSVEFVVGYLAILRTGAIAVPLNPAAPPPERQREIAAVEPCLIVVTDRDAVPGVATIRLDLDELAPDRLPPGRPGEHGDGPPGADGAGIVARSDDDVAVLLFTAGTAGAPRAAMLTHGNLAANIRQVLDHPGLRLTPSDVGFAALPLFHVFGLNVVLGVSLAAGASVVLVDRFDPAASLELFGRHGVAVLAAVPTMYAAWLALDAAAAPAGSFASVRLAVSGAAALPRDVADGFRARFGIVVHEGYGLTEASPIVSTTAIGADDAGSGPRPGSIGVPLPGVEVRVVDADGADVLAGDPGEIRVRGANVFAGYWHDEPATHSVLTDDGWLCTGDIAVVDEHGELHLVDRAKDLVIVSGFNVYPAEVEEVLMAHPDVGEAAVVGEPSPRTGEAVVAYVVARPGHHVDVDALAAHCTRALARYKCPSRIEVVDALPHTLAGKLVRRELRSA
jgi:long-chain acyl-CoA synthetase